MPTSSFMPLLLGGIFVGVLVILAFVFALVRFAKTRAAAQSTALAARLAQLEASGERALIPATPCILRVGAASRPSGRAALTTARIAWCWRSTSGEILLRDVRGVAEATSYSGETRYGVSWVVLTCEGHEIGLGFSTGEHTRWLEHLRTT